jgi:hypothetical protein
VCTSGNVGASPAAETFAAALGILNQPGQTATPCHTRSGCPVCCRGQGTCQPGSGTSWFSRRVAAAGMLTSAALPMSRKRFLSVLLLAFALSPVYGEASASAGAPFGAAVRTDSAYHAEEVFRSAAPQLLRVIEVEVRGFGRGGATASPAAAEAVRTDISGISCGTHATDGLRPFAERLPYDSTAPPVGR